MAVNNGRRTRVLHIVQNLNYGGMERLLFEMIRRSDRGRLDHHVLTLQFVGRFGEGLDEYGGVSVAGQMSRLSLLRPKFLARQIASLQPDVVHTHSGVWYKATRAACMARIPRLIHTEHGRAVPDPWLARRLDSAASRRTDVVVAVSESVAQLLRAGVATHPERVCVIANGVDVDRFRPVADDGALRSELGLSATTPVIGSIGRLEPVKGYEVMVDAYAILRRQWGGDRVPVMVVAGDGSQRAALIARAVNHGVTDGIFWLGWRDDMQSLHSAFTLFTMSSHSEGTSISLLEAMAAGICPVATDVGGNAAVLGPELRGQLVPASNPESLCAAWVAAIRNSSMRERAGCLARSRAVEHFNIENTVRRYEDLYGHAMDRGSR